MKLPDYFLADLSPDAPCTPNLIREACHTLKRNRAQYLAHLPTPELIRILSQIGENWRDPEYPLRRFALEQSPETTGFSRETIEGGLDSFFSGLTRKALEALIVQDLGNLERLDQFTGAPTEPDDSRCALAVGPEFLVHFSPGTIPNPALAQLVLGLLLRSAQFLKCGSGMALLPRLFAHSIYEAVPKLGACLEVAAWPGGNHALEQPLLEEADCVIATGSDETLTQLRSRLPPQTRFVGYGHRVSFAFLSRSVLAPLHLPELARKAAADVVAWDQQGCLSPHVIYVEESGDVTAEQFAEALARELQQSEQSRPRGTLTASAAAAIATRRAFYEVRAAHSPETRFWRSPDSTAWTVVFESDPRFQLSCLNRFVYVKPVADLPDALRAVDTVHQHVSTAGLAAAPSAARPLALELARWGVTRICPLGRMQQPPPLWRHDGRPTLAELVRWTDWEMEPYAV